mmetsp:Transcript_13784/g.29726  ORF Transcript_13784/g.29726 Transcript_13784/m.29726 type:complete len:146 (-) Transcript_13784:338-775(-)
MITQARKNLGPGPEGLAARGVPPGHRVGHFHQEGLQEHKLAPRRYDTIFVQWCLMHLTDDDAVHFLLRAAGALKDGGLIIVKENVGDASTNAIIVHHDDNTVTRSMVHWEELFEKAQVEVVEHDKQHEFDEELFPVYMWALKPKP